MAYQSLTSTAIQNISDINNGEVIITWKTGSSYTYRVADSASFSEELTFVVENQKSIGGFINRLIQEQKLQLSN
jgi:hypothetical protein